MCNIVRLDIISLNLIISSTILIYYLKEAFAIHNPFSIKYSGEFYKSEYSDRNDFKIIAINSYNNSNFSINIGNKLIKNVNLTEKGENLKVKIYPYSYNPFLKSMKEDMKIKLFCYFSYPLTVVATSDSYQCSLSYKDKSGQQHIIGNCPLTLQIKSTFCLISGYINPGFLKNKTSVTVVAKVFHCKSQCVRNVEYNWKGVVSISTELPLISWQHILWMKTFYSPSLNIGVLIGVPKNPINKSTIFEIPVKLMKHNRNKEIVSILIQVTYNLNSLVEEVTPLGCFVLNELKNYEEKDNTFTEISLNKDEGDQCLNGDSDLLCILHWSTKEEVSNLDLRVTIDNMELKNSESISNISQPIISSIKIPLFHGKHNVIPVINNPVILPSFDSLKIPYQFSNSDIKIYYVYSETQFVEVSSNVLCRPFDHSHLKCPPDMKALEPVLQSIAEPESTTWSLELMVDGFLLVLSVEPLVKPFDQWLVIFTDSVLNRISGWRGFDRRSTSLLTESKCEPIYQVAPIKIYKNVVLYDEETKKDMVVHVDMSESLHYSNVRISKEIAYVYKIGKTLIIQGLNYGNLDVELITKDNKTFLKRSMTVYNEAVHVTDIDISCISDIKIFKKILFNSSMITVANISFQFQNLQHPKKCFFIIDVLFSDKTRTNIISFPKDHYNLRFITNTDIIEAFDMNNMWYDYEKFNKQDAFYVELSEPNFCDDPKTIIRKHVKLNNSKERSPAPVNSTLKPNTSNLSSASISSSTLTKETNLDGKTEISNVKSLKNITYLLIAIVFVALIIIVINIIIRYYKNKNSLGYHSRRRKSIIDIENQNTLRKQADYPPLLPPPGPQVQLSDSATVTISSPNSFWSAEPKKYNIIPTGNPFVRQSSLPVKGCADRGFNEIAPCPPLRWTNKMMNDIPHSNSYNSQDGLNTDQSHELHSFSPMTWSVTHMDVEESSGLGSLNTNIDDMIKDPYGSRERFHKLSELPSSNSNKKEHIYDMI